MFERHFIAILLVGTASFFAQNVACAATYYVSQSGSDTNLGTEAEPFHTVQRAADVMAPGDTAIVRDGVYTDEDGDGYVVKIRTAGQSDQKIVFRALNRHGAVLSGNSAQADYVVLITQEAAHVELDGFVVKEGAKMGVYMFGANHITLKNSKIHNNGNVLKDCSYGGGLVGVMTNNHSGNITIKNNTIFENGRLTPEHCDDWFNTYTHDHGLYLQGQPIFVYNNVFYAHDKGFDIKLDGYYAHEDVPDGAFTHFISNNSFGPRANPYTRSGGVIRPFNNRSVDPILGESRDPRMLLQNNLFFEPGRPNRAGSLADTAVRVTTTSNYSGHVLRNNITTSAFLFSEGYSGIAEQVAAYDNLLGRDPLFVSVEDKDFRPAPDSPAKGFGVVEGAPTDDFYGKLRDPNEVDAGPFVLTSVAHIPEPKNVRVSEPSGGG